jgi:hypothetical protein
MATTARITAQPPATPRPSRAMLLIEKLLRDGTCTEEELATELVISPHALANIRAGKIPIPLERQLCLALWLIQRGPRYARLGYQLRGQIEAAMRFGTRSISANDTI